MTRPHWCRAVVCTLAAGLIAVSCGTEFALDTSDPGAATEPDEEAGPEAVTPGPTATPEPTPSPSPIPAPIFAELRVDDTDAVGTLGDQLLSLSEALALANGRLTLPELSDVEARAVIGQPGAGVADTIIVTVGQGVEITVPDVAGWTLQAFGNSGDTLIGGGAVITGQTDQPAEGFNVLLVGSSGFTVEGLTFAGVTQGIGIESAGARLTDVTVRNNTFSDNQAIDISIQNSFNNGGMTGVLIEGNTFEATSAVNDFHNFLTVHAGTGVNGEATVASFVHDLSISGNSMLAAAGTVATCIALSGGFVDFAVDSAVDGAEMLNVVIDANTLAGCGVAVDIAAGRAEQTGSTVSNNAIREVALTDNTVTVGQIGVAIRGGFVQPAPPSFQYQEPVEAWQLGNAVEGVTISGTVLSSLTTAITLAGGEFDVPGTGSAEDNLVTGLDITSTTVVDDVAVACAAQPDVGALASANVLDASCAGLS